MVRGYGLAGETVEAKAPPDIALGDVGIGRARGVCFVIAYPTL